MTLLDPARYNQARDYSLFDLISRDIKLSRKGRDFAGLCPFHSEKTPSFYVVPDKHFFHCFGCGAHGGPIDYIMHTRRLSFIEAVDELAGGARTPLPRAGQRLVTPARSPDPPPPIISELWNAANRDGLVELYLASRGIQVRPRPVPWALRGHSSVLWTEEIGECRATLEPPWRTWFSRKTNSWWKGIEKPAVLAAVTDSQDAVVAVQRVWVDERYEVINGVGPTKGSRATELPDGKKTLGQMGANAVRLSEPGPILGLSEGFESALSAAELFSIPVWSTCGGSRLGSIEMPECVQHVVIFGDNGKAGEKLAAAAVTAYRKRGYRAHSEFPPERDDWNSYHQGYQW